jgi:hypothetical protein
MQIHPIFANVMMEASVVAVVCVFFLILFVVAGVREIMNKNE